ncbi:helix-turn-helix domain-containing protein [Fusobacterium ulcerans]|uniref:helix-turn-helix domain-containing protein n=1 Tax=Fusobacterium ulcerans TaxID=861 RepID=UPI001D0AEC34|nr:helix-turn-helix domain-containing protein [Fusobacterium ulcerans]MCB8564793.1 helix-turn-helix domain-containing protein [Fusobacterium ulcerans]MCB8648825.1 helix-turn-helix domain-containing protein [Fusobacterium ulcerans]
MEREEYIFKKLGNISALDKALAEKIVEDIGEWATVNEVAKYFKKHRNTIYNRVEEGDILHRKMGTSILIYTRSLIFLLE